MLFIKRFLTVILFVAAVVFVAVVISSRVSPRPRQGQIVSTEQYVPVHVYPGLPEDSQRIVLARETIIGYYNTILAREPDDAGLEYWLGQFQSGVPLQAIRQGFYASAEYQAKHPQAPPSSLMTTPQATYHIQTEPEAQQRYEKFLDN